MLTIWLTKTFAQSLWFPFVFWSAAQQPAIVEDIFEMEKKFGKARQQEILAQKPSIFFLKKQDQAAHVNDNTDIETTQAVKHSVRGKYQNHLFQTLRSVEWCSFLKTWPLNWISAQYVLAEWRVSMVSPKVPHAPWFQRTKGQKCNLCLRAQRRYISCGVFSWELSFIFPRPHGAGSWCQMICFLSLSTPEDSKLIRIV